MNTIYSVDSYQRSAMEAAKLFAREYWRPQEREIENFMLSPMTESFKPGKIQATFSVVDGRAVYCVYFVPEKPGKTCARYEIVRCE